MPQELPGFYFNSEKNRYFPIRGPIPGSRAATPGVSPGPPSDSRPPSSNKDIYAGRKVSKRHDLLLNRELCGNTVSMSKQKKSFQQEYENLLMSHPTVWRYQGTEGKSDSAVEEFYIDVQTSFGQRQTSALLVGSMSGSLSLFEIGNPESDFEVGVMCLPDCVWPPTSKDNMECHNVPGAVHIRNGALVPSNISCIKNVRRSSCGEVNDSLDKQLYRGLQMATSVITINCEGPDNALHYLDKTVLSFQFTNSDSFSSSLLAVHCHTRKKNSVTTLGSGTSGGSVCLLNLEAPLDFSQGNPTLQRRMCRITSLPYTIWTADCQPNGTLASVGMNLGAALINLENGALTWVCRSKSDMLSQQFDPSGNFLLCGFRNGKIAAIDIRQKPESQRHIVVHRSAIPYSRSKKRPLSDINCRTSSQQWLKLKGNMACSGIVCAASSVCSLVTLQTYDQYFLASSMDGSIKLYDQRMCCRNAIQSYEGHINTHSHIRLGVDPSESFLMSGGEDGHVRLWSIKSGEMLFDAKVTDSALSNVYWSRVEEFGRMFRSGDDGIMNYSFSSHHSWSAWIGSQKGIFYIHGS